MIKVVNPSGDSDSAEMISGYSLGVQYGSAAIPACLIWQLELRKVIEQMSEDAQLFLGGFWGKAGPVRPFDGSIGHAFAPRLCTSNGN
ncbi:hypothetical protein [Pseudomonas sp. HY7a-MNA-CIBAN-0227]|uniref:hypothetical protein n=1 Tax=Pseudomonas sp. HY7a-MNA-CIBAN-0227 TaxID=3140474 RepID=UPI003321FB56